MGKWERKINAYAQQKVEFGASGVVEKVAEIEALIKQKVAELDALPIDAELAKAEPDDLPSILKLRPSGSRRVWSSIPADFRDRLEGSWLGRCAGCTLGSIVEGWDVERMERWAEYLGDEYPLVDYWSQAEQPHQTKYETSLREDFTPSKMDGVPTDDDLNYTLLGLMIVEEYGPDFSSADLGEAWVKYLPFRLHCRRHRAGQFAGGRARGPFGRSRQSLPQLDRRRYPLRSLGLCRAGLSGKSCGIRLS